MSNPFDKTTLK